MPDVFAAPVHNQKGPYNSAAHESLRAAARCLIARYGEADGRRRVNHLLDFMDVVYGSQLSPEGAHSCRKFLEVQLSPHGDLAG